MSFSYTRLSCLLAGCLFFGAEGVRAQGLKPVVTAGLGLVENLQGNLDLGQPRFALYPEVEVSTEIVRSRKALLTLSGGVYAGGWTDGVDRPSGCADCITYSHSSFLAGARLGVSLDAFPLPLFVWGGASRQLIFARYVGGAGIAGDTGSDHRDDYTAVEAGARLQVPVGARLRVGGDVLVYLPVLVSEQNPNLVRTKFGLAVTYAP